VLYYHYSVGTAVVTVDAAAATGVDVADGGLINKSANSASKRNANMPCVSISATLNGGTYVTICMYIM
jgi:pyruvate carboxylase